MKRLYPVALVLCVLSFASLVFAREAKLVRYPSYSNGRIAFTYLADIWVADENGGNIQRLTVNRHTKHTNMENYGVQPDIRVDNLPEDNLAGRDRQLDVAVEDLMKQLSSPKRNIASKEQQ